jgi:hypothetical protein
LSWNFYCRYRISRLMFPDWCCSFSYTLRKTLADNKESAKWEDDCRWAGRVLLVKTKFPSEEEIFPYQQEFSSSPEGNFLLTSKTLPVYRKSSSHFADSLLSASVFLRVYVSEIPNLIFEIVHWSNLSMSNFNPKNGHIREVIEIRNYNLNYNWPLA